jgi:hypothetical protein
MAPNPVHGISGNCQSLTSTGVQPIEPKTEVPITNHTIGEHIHEVFSLFD